MSELVHGIGPARNRFIRAPARFGQESSSSAPMTTRSILLQLVEASEAPLRTLSLIAIVGYLGSLTACSRPEALTSAPQVGDSITQLAAKRHRRTSEPTAQAPLGAHVIDAQTGHTPSTNAPIVAQNGGPLCCCRSFAQGWQHAWRGQSVCEAAGGQCVAPDNCRQ